MNSEQQDTPRMQRARQLEGHEPSMDEVYDALRDFVAKIDAVTLRGEAETGKLTPEIVVLAELANALDYLQQTRGYPPAVWHAIPFNLSLKSAMSVFPTLWREAAKIDTKPT